MIYTFEVKPGDDTLWTAEAAEMEPRGEDFQIGMNDGIDFWLPVVSHEFWLQVIDGDVHLEDDLPSAVADSGKMRRIAAESGKLRFRPRCTGPVKLRLETTSLDQGPSRGPWVDLFVKGFLEDWEKAPLPLNAGCLLSVISVRLGHVSRWESVLASAARQVFNVIHFTPVQKLGHSGSSYSLGDQLEVNAALAENWDELRETLEALRAKYGFSLASDLVLNHAANSATFLKEHPECGYNQVNSPWLNGAIELDNVIDQSQILSTPSPNSNSNPKLNDVKVCVRVCR